MMSSFQTESSWFAYTEWKAKYSIEKARSSKKDNVVVVDWETEDDNYRNLKRRKTDDVKGGSLSPSTSSSSYPFIWLRDFCHCEECFDEPSITKKTNLQDLSFDTSATEVSSDKHGQLLKVRWSDAHESAYPANWLWCNRFHETVADSFMDIPPELWRADTIGNRLREFQFDSLMTSDEALYDWMKEVKVLGLTLIKNAPENEDALRQLGQRVGYLKDTNFGPLSEVYAPTDPSNPVYTAGNLYFHTDLTYYHQPPGIELLHCIKQFEGEGGDNTLVDGFGVALQIKQADPEAFKALSSHDVEFYQTGRQGPGRYFQMARNKIIRLDANDRLAQISYSNHSRTSVLRIPPEKVTHFYKAMKLFTDLLYDSSNMYTYKMKPGDIIVINNFRVLHGRKGFEMKKGSVRHLATAYLDWDLVYSRLRVLHKQLSLE